MLMSWYNVALIVHIVGVLTLFITLGLQWLSMLRLRRAGSLTQVRKWSGLATRVLRLAPVSGALILGAGVYMTVVAWTLLTAWIDVALAAMLIMMILGMGVVGRRLTAIQRTAAEVTRDVQASTGDAIPAALRSRIDDPALWVSMQTALAVVLGIVVLMNAKPSLSASIVVVIVSLALGVVIGTLTLRPHHLAQSAMKRAREPMSTSA